MEKVLLQKNNNMDCFDINIIAVLSKIYNLRYDHYFLKSYNVIYKSNEDFLNNRDLDYGHSYRIDGLDTLAEIYNFKYKLINKFELEDKNAIISMLKENIINQNPVALTVDTYGCPWSHFYLEKHMLHTILLLDYDEETNVFYSTDPYLEVENISLDIETLLKYWDWTIIFDMSSYKNNELSQDASDLIIKKYIDRYDEEDFIKPFMSLYEDFQNYKYNPNDIDLYKSPDKSYLLTRFAALSWSRKNVSDALSNYDEIYNSDKYSDVVQKLTFLATDWNKIRNVLAFMMIRASKDKQYIFRGSHMDKMLTLIETEKEVFKEIKK